MRSFRSRFGRRFRWLVFSALAPLAAALRAEPVPAPVSLAHFITRSGDRLLDGTNEFRYVSVNMPDSLQIISNYRFDAEQPASRYRLPDDFELRDCVRTVRQLGGRVLRTFVITCRRDAQPEFAFNVATDPAVPNEAALHVLDRLLQLCHQEGIRLIIPLVAYNSSVRGDWHTYGEDFWTVGSPGNLRFKSMLRRLLPRTNPLTGLSYLDDPAILGWQTGNELVIGDHADRRAWLHDIAAFIKSIDSRHLLIDGRNKPDDVYGRYDEFAADPHIDAVSYHTYVNLPQADTPAGTLRLIRAQLRGKIPLLVTEVAMYTPPAALRALLDEVLADGTVGANWWALRFHNRDGGFYKHSDRNSQFEDLNWPGFADPDHYLPEIDRERELLSILTDYAARIAHTSLPPLPIPDAPHLLPAADVGHIAWRGSTGATGYEIQRAAAASGPWTTLQGDFHDHLAVYASLFSDGTATIGAANYYRVLAHNAAGTSAASNVVGPLRPDRRWLIDDLFDSSQLAPGSRNVRIAKAYAHSAYLEDVGVALRADPAQPAVLVYRVPGALRNFSVAVFADDTPLHFFVHRADGARRPVKPLATPHDHGRRTLYHADLPDDADTLEIQLDAAPSSPQAIGRVELGYLPRS